MSEPARSTHSARPAGPAGKGTPLFDGADWTFDTLRRVYDAIDEVAGQELDLNLYTNQIEIISSEQMLDAYSSIGMPLMYRHWSFGKHFVRNERLYRKGAMGLAYEVVINSDPCISYCMEENTMAMQTLVMAHAAFGHNHFFKNNHLFRQWTDAEGILDYLEYARGYIADCEEKYGIAEVERLLDAAHALMPHGVFRYDRRRKSSLKQDQERRRERLEHEERAGPASAGGKPALFPGALQPGAGALAAGNAAHHPQHRAIFLSAETDPADERGLCLFRTFPPDQCALRAGPPDRRNDAGNSAQSHQCAVAA